MISSEKKTRKKVKIKSIACAFKMEKQFKYLILMLLFVRQSANIRCMNNYCECNELKDELKCTNNNNKESINLILNQLINSEIKSLDLSFNKLDNINIEIKSIIKLNLSNNRLLIIKENQFSKLNKLEILDLSYNELFYIELNAFYGLNNVLQVLHLQNNHLTELYQNNLDNLQQLKYINFDSNKIKKIRNNVFTSMTSIESISFQFT